MRAYRDLAPSLRRTSELGKGRILSGSAVSPIDRELPLEASIVRREVELGRALTDKEIEEEISEFQAKAQPKAA